MFTPINSKNHGILSDTVMSTPYPQASSTVCRKNTLESRFTDMVHSKKEKGKQDLQSEPETQADDSSLGLLELSGYSKMELECARKILQKCSNTNPSATDTNKENNANVQNTTGSVPISSFTLPLVGTYLSELDKECTNPTISKDSIASVNFEPNEITARSSGVSSSSKRQSPINRPFDSINFSVNDVMAQFNNDEIMSEINNEEFLSGSKIVDQFSIDEASRQQDLTYCMPVMNSEKQKINIDSFSGIYGELDLTTESCTGRKISVGQYFERKSRNIGSLGNNEKMRPSIGVTLESPVRKGKLQALVESTIMTDGMSTMEKEDTFISSAAKDIDENSIISLNTIINTLHDINSKTPRRLVDKLLMAQKKKKSSILPDNTRTETFKLPSNENSILAISAIPTGVSKKFDDINIENFSAKLSLDSKTKNKTANEIDKKQECMRASLLSTTNDKQLEKKSDKNLTSYISDSGVTSTSDFAFPLQNSTLPCNDKLHALSNISLKMNRKSFDEESYNNLNIQSKDVSKEKDTSNNLLLPANSEIQSDLTKAVILGTNTEELCNCIVGITNEVNIELINSGDRWITYSFKLIEIRGNKQNIELNIPSEGTLINPNGSQSTKIEIKVTKMCQPLFVVLNILLSDMVAKSKWSINHKIFVSPTQLELDVIYPFDEQKLIFQNITEETTKVLPITFYNKNNIDVPVQLSISHDALKMFSIDEPTRFTLKSFEKSTINIKCEKSRSTLIDSPQRQPHHWKSKLIINVHHKDGTILFRKEIPLYAQMYIYKIQIIDTELPIVVPRQQGKLINIVNLGNVATHVFATVVPIEHSNAMPDFLITPDSIFLQVGEKSSFLIVDKTQFSTNSINHERYAKIKLVAGNNVYHYIISTEQKSLESEKENYLRCHTPNNVTYLSPATSPQSVTSTKSGPFDRNSPISTISSTVSGNTIPIRATHAALVWSSVKTGKSEIKEFTIRNTSNNKIKIQVDICDDSKSFKFVGDKQMINTSMVLAMQRQESKILAVMFNPCCAGPVVGKITIKHYTKETNDSQQLKRIPLYGYGGCSKVKITSTYKDANGKMWLPLGNLYSETTTLNASITLHNIGDLRAFVKVTIVPKVIFPTINSSWCINPKEVILNSKETQEISIQFHPKKEDFALLQCREVSHVATINITYGDEPTRWRIRRLYNKMKELNESNMNTDEAFKNIVHPICKVFPGEQLIPGLTSIRDSIQNLNDLCTGVRQYEIMLTVEACADDTLPVHYDTDESEMFQSLISDTTLLDEAGGASFFAFQTMVEREVQHPESQDQFTVTPSTIVLTPPIQNEATVTILNFFKVAESFQTNLSNSNYLSVVPAEGMLPSKKSFPLKIQCSQKIERNMQAVLEIYTRNSKQDVLIKVVVKRQ
ncbi:hypothetical protein PUN28_007005 [Cardiocondyla obscurior]|uniref:Centrosomal protein of 192 kDa n=1 Tax=Cardiocondyla obscurior TaxID=286306 RepID=A0AAW2G1G8_9HYME